MVKRTLFLLAVPSAMNMPKSSPNCSSQNLGMTGLVHGLTVLIVSLTTTICVGEGIHLIVFTLSSSLSFSVSVYQCSVLIGCFSVYRCIIPYMVLISIFSGA